MYRIFFLNFCYFLSSFENLISYERLHTIPGGHEYFRNLWYNVEEVFDAFVSLCLSPYATSNVLCNTCSNRPSLVRHATIPLSNTISVQSTGIIFFCLFNSLTLFFYRSIFNDNIIHNLKMKSFVASYLPYHVHGNVVFITLDVR
jgi:hypothetical protein